MERFRERLREIIEKLKSGCRKFIEFWKDFMNTSFDETDINALFKNPDGVLSHEEIKSLREALMEQDKRGSDLTTATEERQGFLRVPTTPTIRGGETGKNDQSKGTPKEEIERE